MIFSPNFHFKHFPFLSHTHCLSQTHTELDCSNPHTEPNGTIHTPTHHHLHSTRERECASEIAPAPFAPRTQSFDFESHHEPRASTSPATQRLRATNPELRLRITPIDFAGEPRSQDRRSTSTSPAPIALSSRLRNSWVLMNLTGFDEFFLVGF